MAEFFFNIYLDAEGRAYVGGPSPNREKAEIVGRISERHGTGGQKLAYRVHVSMKDKTNG